ncbi:component of SufBCD complex [Litoreibacter roseus]|uniref:Component of SufBCD complex n=1 Tax=Litoreibacter roseus TaxID=2601869 RepID=A0A6N6JKR8_9RHOB|nr:component of SufBCD complex [Litoreibacter roseus]GFE66906.1 hypothetical protein KIN_39800 [Litoreibacter roseus]
MSFYQTVFELIDLRSFSNLWFWIMLAVLWSTASHFVIGVPFDMVTRANRVGGQAETDLRDLVRINANRLTYIADTAGSWLTGFVFFIISGLIILGFSYEVEFCQALTFIFGPMALVFALSIRTARRVHGQEIATIKTRLKRHRLSVQIIGLFSILATSMWGMYFNLTTSSLGG